MTPAISNEESERTETAAQVRQNGAAAAAILAAGIGSLILAVLSILADRSTAWKNTLDFYKPTGALSGVSMVTTILWLFVWFVLDRRWKKRNLSLRRVNIVAITLLVLSLLATFPPIADLF